MEVNRVVQKWAKDFGVVAQLRAGPPRVWGFLHGKANVFLFVQKRPDRLWAPTPSPVQRVPVAVALGTKRSERGAHHLHRVQCLTLHCMKFPKT
jgi:hypothetical protein